MDKAVLKTQHINIYTYIYKSTFFMRAQFSANLCGFKKTHM